MMRMLKVGSGLFFALIMGLVWISCDSSPTGPSESSAQGNRLSGRFTNLGSAGSAFQGFAQSTLEGITVYVREVPAIQTRVSSDGSFALRELPDGRFTLVFGDSLGDLLFDRVLPNTEFTIVVQLTSRGRVRQVDEKRTGIGHGDLEIEGLVQAVSPGAHPNEGSLMVHNYDIEARPGSTTIREGYFGELRESSRHRGQNTKERVANPDPTINQSKSRFRKKGTGWTGPFSRSIVLRPLNTFFSPILYS